MTNENWRVEFDKEFVAIGADIEGMKRVEYRQLREHQVDNIKFFIQTQMEKLVNKIPEYQNDKQIQNAMHELKQELRDYING